MTISKFNRYIGGCFIVLGLPSLVLGHRSDDWATLDHQTFKVTGIDSSNAIRIQVGNENQTIQLLGIAGVDAGRAWLKEHVLGREVTLLLGSPQTRDSSGPVRAFVFLDDQNVSVELVKAGLAYADRREKTIMDGLIDPAESDARKKKRGLWNGLAEAQMPLWRQQWLRSIPHAAR